MERETFDLRWEGIPHEIFLILKQVCDKIGAMIRKLGNFGGGRMTTIERFVGKIGVVRVRQNMRVE